MADAWNMGAIVYDAEPDVQHFIINAFNPIVSQPATMVLNWRSALRRMPGAIAIL